MHALSYLFFPSLVSAAAIGLRDGYCSRAAYFLKNDPAGSSIISLKISDWDGTLSDPVETPTGGKGLIGLTASSTGGPPTTNQAGEQLNFSHRVLLIFPQTRCSLRIPSRSPKT